MIEFWISLYGFTALTAMSVDSYVRGVRKDLARDALNEATKSALQSEYNNNQAANELSKVSDTLESIIDIVKGSGSASKCMEIESVYYIIKNTIEQLPLEQQAAIANVFACIVLLICFTSIVGIFVRDCLIQYFRLEEWGLSWFWALRRKLRWYFFIWYSIYMCIGIFFLLFFNLFVLLKDYMF